jgi:hypothetical protein
MKFTNTDNVEQQKFFKIFYLVYSQMKTKNMAVYNHVREQVGDIIAPIQIAIYQEIDK